MKINVGDAVRRAIQQVAANYATHKSGLLVPPDVVAGKHYGGFDGYTPWIKDCITVCLQSVRGVGADELSELTALALWQAAPTPIHFVVLKHAEAMVKLDQLAQRVADMTGKGGLSDKVAEQVRRANGTRERGSLLVVALNPVEAEETGELRASTSAWSAASVEAALAEPKRQFVLG